MPSRDAGPLVPIPKTIKIQVKKNPPKFEDMPVHLPFYYASLANIWVYYRADPKRLEPFLADSGLKPAMFEGQGAIAINFQTYTGHNGTGLATCNEVEFNIVCYPEKSEAETPSMPLKEFVRGMDATKTIGMFRVFVPADNVFAVAAGIAFFGESKFAAGFEYNVPALNNPNQKTYEYTVYDTLLDPGKPLSKAEKKKHRIYTQKADLRSYQPEPVNATPLTLYSMLPGGPFVPESNKGSRLIGSRWTIFSMYEAYFPDPESAKKNIKLSWGPSDHPMKTGMRKILGRSEGAAAAVVTSVSPPAAAEPRAYYV